MRTTLQNIAHIATCVTLALVGAASVRRIGREQSEIGPGFGELFKLRGQVSSERGQLIRRDEAQHLVQVDAVNDHPGVTSIALPLAVSRDDQAIVIHRGFRPDSPNDSGGWHGCFCRVAF